MYLLNEILKCLFWKYQINIFFSKIDPQHFLHPKPFTEVDTNVQIKPILSIILNVNVLKALWSKQADQ